MSAQEDNSGQRSVGIADKIASLSPEKRQLLQQQMAAQFLSGSALLARALKELGITHVYTLPGSQIYNTLSECESVGIRVITVRHQQAAVLMAIAQNYLSGKLSAAVLTSAGPAVTNTLTGVLVARDNGWPVLILAGRRALSLHQQGVFQDLASVSIFKTVTKLSKTITATSNLESDLKNAFSVACAGRNGPVYLEVPEDILVNGHSGDTANSGIAVMDSTEDRAPMLNEAESWLQSARRPLLIIGTELYSSDVRNTLFAQVESLNIPFISAPMARGYLPDGHSLCFNNMQSEIQSQADVILLAGYPLDWTFRFGSEFNTDARLIHIESGHVENAASYPSTVHLLGNPGSLLCRLLATIKKTPWRDTVTEWLAELDQVRQQNRRKLQEKMQNESLPMSAYRMMKEIRDWLPEQAITIFDSNITMAIAQQVIPADAPASRMTAGANGCMGVGIPFAIGAKICYPYRPVVVICGNTAFGFNALEIETAVKQGLAVIIVIANNCNEQTHLRSQCLSSQSQTQQTASHAEKGYAQIAIALGGYGERVERPADLHAALERSMASGLPAVLDVQLQPTSNYPRYGMHNEE